MEKRHNHKQYRSLLHFFCYWLLFIVNAEALTVPKALNSTVTAVLVFGDSTVDAGNNNFVATMFKGNFPPYGKDFAGQVPTGRFSNGRLATDFVASYVGVKDYVPPYLDPTLSIEDLMTGVSFASAGTGFDPLTPKISNVIEIQKQVEYFREYKKRLESAIGKQRMKAHIKKTLFVISAGTNDFVVNYFTLPIRPKTYTVAGYQQFILQKKMQFLQDLLDEGARKMLITSLPPMGCLPVVITLFSDNAIFGRGCLDYYSSVGRDFNMMLQKKIDLMKPKLAELRAKIYLNDAYAGLSNMIHGPASSAFEKVNEGCCGTGYLEAGLMCNPKSFVCADASKYVFWDSIHPTEQTYFNLFMSFRPNIDAVIRD